MQQVTLLGIDLAKRVFQVCGLDRRGEVMFNRNVSRARLEAFIQQYPEATVAMEACSGSNYWGRRFQTLGHRTLLIPPQHVKPFVKGNKNDRNDALAICEASQRPGIRFVAPRTLEQTEVLMAHRVRDRLVRGRTQLINQIRGLLNEFGVVLPQGRSRLHERLPAVLEDPDNELTADAREMVGELLQEFLGLEARIKTLDRRIRRQARQQPVAQRLLGVHGVGPMTSSAAWAVLGDGEAFRSGRHFAANLGLVPSQHSSGGRQKLGAITKRGNRYLRFLLIQGAHSVVTTAHRHPEDRLSRWALKVLARRGRQKAVVAVANKLARILWALVAHHRPYQAEGWARG